MPRCARHYAAHPEDRGADVMISACLTIAKGTADESQK